MKNNSIQKLSIFLKSQIDIYQSCKIVDEKYRSQRSGLASQGALSSKEKDSNKESNLGSGLIDNLFFQTSIHTHIHTDSVRVDEYLNSRVEYLTPSE